MSAYTFAPALSMPLTHSCEAWLNVNTATCGDFNNIHAHVGATWSGVMYCKSADAVTDEGGQLQI